jgi:prepilin-type N-terminal cleavage/methylation domain-containing protein
MYKKGITLIEILIVIVIMGIVAGIAILFFGRSEPVFNLNAGADMLQADLSLAKQRALSRFDNTVMWEIVFTPGSNQYTINAYDTAGIRADLTQVKILPAEITIAFDNNDFSSLGAWPNELVLAALVPNQAAFFSGNSPLVRFMPDGRARNDLNADFNVGYIIMRNELGNVKLFLITGMTGRIKVHTLFTDGTAFD